jgi:purine-binding chemotaxis protein CheW
MRQSTSTVGQQQPAGGKFLTFFLAEEEYGFEILKVQEIIGMMNVTPVPRMPPFVKGVINLRGKVIPIIDLRLKFAMPAAAQTEETCIIVVRAQGVVMGIVVDKVSEVLDIAPEDIDALSCGAAVNTDYILGIGKAVGQVKVLLDIDKVLSTNEVVELRATALEDRCMVARA